MIDSPYSGSNAEVKRVISEGLSLVRGCQPLRLNVTQLACLAKHFQQRVSFTHYITMISSIIASSYRQSWWWRLMKVRLEKIKVFCLL